MDSIDDKRDYNAVNHALKSAKMPQNEIDTIWKLVAAIIVLVITFFLQTIHRNYLIVFVFFIVIFICVFFLIYVYFLKGNITFNQEDDQAFVSDNEGLMALSKLLNVSSKDCSKALCYRVVAARGEVIEKGHNKNDAVYGKNSFAKVNNCCCKRIDLVPTKYWSIHTIHTFPLCLLIPFTTCRFNFYKTPNMQCTFEFGDASCE